MSTDPARVLVVEDHAALREVYAELCAREADLTLCGSVESAEEALEILDEIRCDVAVVDVSLPGMDGFELVRRIHERYRDLPVLVVSAHHEESYARRAREGGAVAYLSKQGLVSALPRAIRSALGRGA